MKPTLKASRHIYAIRAAILLTLVLAIAGCSTSGAQKPLGSEQPTEGVAITPTSVSAVPLATASQPAPTRTPLSCENTTFPTSAPATVTAGAMGTPKAETAPSFWEIRRTTECILARHPATPSIHRELPDEFVDYVHYTEGQRIEGWEGWVRIVEVRAKRGRDVSVTDLDDGFYNLGVYMSLSPRLRVTGLDNATWLSDVYFGITKDQVEELRRWIASHPDADWIKISFSGVLGRVYIDGLVNILNVTLDPIE
ncbi:MAG: hypothetical protein ABIO92_01095 [Chloroflexia bacterium]